MQLWEGGREGRFGTRLMVVAVGLLMVVSAWAAITASAAAAGPARPGGVEGTLALTGPASSPAPSAGPTCTARVTGENAQNNAIQTLIDQVHAGSTICIGAGTFPEQLNISKPLTLIGAGNTSTILEPQAPLAFTTYDYDSASSVGDFASLTPAAAIVLVANTTGVTIEDLGVSGAAATSTFTSCAQDYFGVDFQSSSGTLNATTVTDIELPTNLFGCQPGLAVYAYNGHFFTGSTPSPALAVTVSNSTVTAYDKNGVTCDDLGEACSVVSDTVTGVGPTSLIAQNGIQVAYGASATVTGDRVTGDHYIPGLNADYFGSATTAAGILVYDAGNTVQITGNTLSGNDLGIAVLGTAASTVSDNTITQGYAYGITLDLNASSGYLGLPVYSTDTPRVATVQGNSIADVNVGLLIYDDNATVSGGSITGTNVSVESMMDQASAYAVSIGGLTAQATVSGALLGNISGFQSTAGYYPLAVGAYTLSDDSFTATGTAPSGAQYGILLNVSSATVTGSSVTGFGVGIQGGYVYPVAITEPTGTYVLRGNTVTAPTGGGVAGDEGILVAGASVTVTNDTVSGYYLQTTTTAGGTTYSSWFEDVQSVGIFVGCAQGSASCTVASNTVSDSSIGIVYTLLTYGFQGITPSAATITGNTITDSGAYGLLAEPTGAAGTTQVTDNRIDNTASGAPAVFLDGMAFELSGNVFVGTSPSGSNGADQGQDGCGAPTIATASVEASDCFNGVTAVTMNANVFEDTSVYWSSTFPSNPSGSYLHGGEVVTFSETGLPTGTTWSVTLAGTLGAVAAPGGLAGDLQNGSFAYVIGEVAGYYQTTLPYSGSVTVSGAAVVEPTLVFSPPTAGQVIVTASGISTDPSLVAVSGRTANVLTSFSGNITDYWANSTLNGHGFTVDATGYPSDAAVVGVAANGITVENLGTVSSGSTDGILVLPAVTSVTIASSTVTLAAGSTTAGGIQAGNVFPATEVEPTGTFTVTGTTVTGPGSGGTAGEIGILVFGGSVTLSGNTVSGFSLETTSTNASNGGSSYSSWFEDTQSVGIFAGCAAGSPVCLMASNDLSDNSIGIVDALMTSGFQAITPAAATIEANTITDSLAFGLVAEPTGASGTTLVASNVFGNALSGAPGAFLIGTTFSVTGNVFIGTSPGGSNGPYQGQDSCDGGYNMATSSVEVSDACNPTTVATLNANVFEGTTSYWASSFHHGNPGSAVSGGELVTFFESGLPSGTTWGVTVDGTPGAVAAPNAIVADLQNSSSPYPFTVASVLGFVALPPYGTVTVNRSAVGETIDFTPAGYAITVTESGLPAGTTWFVNVTGGAAYSSATSVVVLNERNGVYSYTLGTADRNYAGAPGSFTVNDGPLAFGVAFREVTYTVTFLEAGVPSGLTWYLNLTNGQTYNTTALQISFPEPNGSYGYSFGGTFSFPKYYSALPGTFVVHGGPYSTAVTFTEERQVILTENGLPSGMSWWANFTGGYSFLTSKTTLVLYVPAGTWTYKLAAANLDYAAKGRTFTVHSPLAKPNVALKFGVKFTLEVFRTTFTETGLPHGSKWCVVLGAGGIYCSKSTTVHFNEPNGSYTYTLATTKAGYAGTGGSFTVHGVTAVPVTFTASGGHHPGAAGVVGAFTASGRGVTASGGLPLVGVGGIGLVLGLRRRSGGKRRRDGT